MIYFGIQIPDELWPRLTEETWRAYFQTELGDPEEFASRLKNEYNTRTKPLIAGWFNEARLFDCATALETGFREMWNRRRSPADHDLYLPTIQEVAQNPADFIPHES